VTRVLLLLLLLVGSAAAMLTVFQRQVPVPPGGCDVGPFYDDFERVGTALGPNWTSATTMGGNAPLMRAFEGYQSTWDPDTEPTPPTPYRQNFAYWNDAFPTTAGTHVCVNNSGNEEGVGAGRDCACIIDEANADWMCCCEEGDVWGNLGVKTARTGENGVESLLFTSTDHDVQVGDHIGIERVNATTFRCYTVPWTADADRVLHPWTKFGPDFTRPGAPMGPGHPGVYMADIDWLNEAWSAGCGELPYDYYCGYPPPPPMTGPVEDPFETYNGGMPTDWRFSQPVTDTNNTALIVHNSEVDGVNNAVVAGSSNFIEWNTTARLDPPNGYACTGISAAMTSTPRTDSFMGPAFVNDYGKDVVACVVSQGQLRLKVVQRSVAADDVLIASYTPPVASYVGIRRTDLETFQCYTSPDGTTWTAQGSPQTITGLVPDMFGGFWLATKGVANSTFPEAASSLGYLVENWGAGPGPLPTASPCGGQPPARAWCQQGLGDHLSPLACWMLDEPAGQARVAYGNYAGNPTLRQLTEGTGGAVANDTTNKMEGAASAVLNLPLSLKSSDVQLRALTAPYTVMFWAAPSAGTGRTIVENRNATNGANGTGLVLDWDSGLVKHAARRALGATIEALQESGTSPIGTWRHVAITHAGTPATASGDPPIPGTQCALFVNGVPSATSTSCTAYTLLGGGADVFRLGGADIAAPTSALKSFVGNVDEVVVADSAWTAGAICRVCSCGIRGEQCICAGPLYTNTGRNLTSCNNCLLPADCAAGLPVPVEPTTTTSSTGVTTSSTTSSTTTSSTTSSSSSTVPTTTSTSVTTPPVTTTTLPVPPVLPAVGAPAAYTGDTWPTPTRTLWVDRCGRGNAGPCGSVACSDANDCTLKGAPCCTLRRANQRSQAGDLINVRSGANSADVYWEVDDVDSKWAVATLSFFTKGTARCVGGSKAGWGCTTTAGCPGSTCAYKPVVWKAFAESDGSRAIINPGGHHPTDPIFGGTNCNGGVPGRYIGLNFGNPACVGTNNDRLECFGGTEEGKPCTADGDCGGGGTCGTTPWYVIVDGFTLSGWNFWDSRDTINDTQNYCSEKALNINGNGEGCPVPTGITIQNNAFLQNGGFGVLWMHGTAGARIFHNRFRDNITRGYTTQVNHWQAQDQLRNRVTYIWGNDIGQGGDYVPEWAHGGSRWWDGGAISSCRPSGTPPTLTCLDGPNAGASCTGEGLTKECGYGHCGGLCVFDISYNGNPVGQGYQCECTATSQCQAGLTCQPTAGSGPSGNTEGRGIIVDRGSNFSAIDFRNNIIWKNQGDCISLFLADAGSVAKGHGAIVNNTCYQNAKKGASYGELNLIARYLDIFNNLIVMNPFGTCKAGANGGQVCTAYGTNGGTCASDGFGCEIPGFYQYDNVDLYTNCPWGLCYGDDHNAFGGTTVLSDKNLFWTNLTGVTTDPRTFEYAPPSSGEVRNKALSDYRAYGTSSSLTRDQNSVIGDPGFMSTDPASSDFLRPHGGSPARGAGSAIHAPLFDIDGTTRANPPSIGAREASNIAPTTTTSTSSTTSSSTSTTTTTTTSSSTSSSTSSTGTTVAATTTTLAPVPAPSWVSSMLAAWMLDEASGTRVNAQGNTSLNLTVGSAGSTTVNKMEGAAAADISGTSLSPGITTTFSNLVSPFSMGCWGRPVNGGVSYGVMMNKWPTTNGFLIDQENAAYKFYTSVAGTSFATTTPLVAGAYAHITGTYGAPTMRLYKNGALADTKTTTGTLAADSALPFQLSTTQCGGCQWSGQLDECFVANVELSAAAICRICSCGLRGEQCMCSGTSYTSTGRNAASCGSCTLPTDCSATTPP